MDREQTDQMDSQIERVLLRPTEAARALGCSRTRINELVHAGELPHVRLGSSIRIPTEAIQKLVDDAMKAREKGQ